MVSDLLIVTVHGSSSPYFAAMERAFRKPMDELDEEMFSKLTAEETTCALLLHDAVPVGVIAYQIFEGVKASRKRLEVSPLWVVKTENLTNQNIYVAALLGQIEAVVPTIRGLGWVHIRFPSYLSDQSQKILKYQHSPDSPCVSKEKTPFLDMMRWNGPAHEHPSLSRLPGKSRALAPIATQAAEETASPEGDTQPPSAGMTDESHKDPSMARYAPQPAKAPAS